MPQTAERRFSATRLVAARKRAGLSREHVAFAVRVSHVTVVNWETGRSTPRTTLSLAELASCLDCSIDDLFEDVRPTGIHADGDAPMSSPGGGSRQRGGADKTKGRA